MEDRIMIRVSREAHAELRYLAEGLGIRLREATAMLIADYYQIIRQALCRGISHDQIKNWSELVMETARTYATRPEVAPIDAPDMVTILRESNRLSSMAYRIQVIATHETYFKIGVIRLALGQKDIEDAIELIARSYGALIRDLEARGLLGSELEYMKTQILNTALVAWS